MLLKNKFDPYANRVTFDSQDLETKFFLNNNIEEFEKEVNDFLKKSNVQIMDLNYYKKDREHLLMIMYNKNNNSLNKNVYRSNELRISVNSHPNFDVFSRDLNEYLKTKKMKVVDIQHNYSTTFSSLILYQP